MGHSPAVLLLDDGELDDVQAILDDCQISYGRVRGGAIVPNTPAPNRLLVTTPRRIEAVQFGDAQATDLVRIVVVSEDSPTLRAQLRAVGFDYLVRRPVHPEALRLLLLHCIYQGEERRAEPRIPVGLHVSFRTGLLPRKAMLADLSTRGCRIQSRWAIEPGKRIRVTIPESAGVSESITMRGEVVRMSLDERLGPEGPYSAAVSFERVPDKARRELEWLLTERARGPATLRPDGSSADVPLDAPETCDSDGMAHGISVEVDIRMDASTPLPLVEPMIAPIHNPQEQPGGEPLAPPLRAPMLDPVAAFDSGEHGDAAAGDPTGGGAPNPDDSMPPIVIEDERREGQRGAYPMRVPAFGDRAMRVLV
ncbi:MAG: PilZ domain-containing protein, partial [Myxococcota bacterium]